MDRRFIFEEAEKEHFTRLMREYEAFCKVRVLKYCVMSNHYHGLTQDPKDYRWCGYGEAVAGIRIAKEGFKLLMNARDGVDDSLTAAMATYRVWLFGQGEQNEGLDEQGRPVRCGIDPERVREVIAAKGKLRIHDYARCRVRYFVEGAVFGTREFVEEIFQTYRQRFSSNRESGARSVRGLDGLAMFVLRDPRKSAFG